MKLVAKNCILINGEDSMAFSISRVKEVAIVAFFKDHKLEKEVVVDLAGVNQYWLEAKRKGYKVAF